VTGAADALACWCGNADLAPFSTYYVHCRACETLVALRRPPQDLTKVGEDERGFYGREYWFSHQRQAVNQPDIRARAVADLPERCVFWLRTILKYKLPPAVVQELGSAHGGFVALLRRAGYEATGLELSPFIADFARQLFNVPVRRGPLEEQPIPAGSLDVLALMDVLEHLPDPSQTMGHGLRLMKPDGVVVAQTPAFPEGSRYDDLVARNDPFLHNLHDRQDEHLFLFSRSSVRQFFERLGCPVLEFEPAIFPQHDMYFVASRVPLAPAAPEAIADALTRTPDARVVAALLDAAGRRDYFHAEAAKRLEVIEVLAKEVERLRGLAASPGGGERA
jgi:SAM-dependent methyltransferase